MAFWAELEGAKLDIVILYHRINSIANSKVGDSIGHDDDDDDEEINRLRCELSAEKEKTKKVKKLESDIHLIVRERNAEVEELKQKINSLEITISKSEETNASLNLAINLIMQENTV